MQKMMKRTRTDLARYQSIFAWEVLISPCARGMGSVSSSIARKRMTMTIPFFFCCGRRGGCRCRCSYITEHQSAEVFCNMFVIRNSNRAPSLGLVLRTDLRLKNPSKGCDEKACRMSEGFRLRSSVDTRRKSTYGMELTRILFS